MRLVNFPAKREISENSESYRKILTGLVTMKCSVNVN